MSKNKIILVSLFLLIGSISFRVFYKNVTTNTTVDYKIYIDSEESDTFPTTKDYKTSVSCLKGKGTIKWDYSSSSWKFNISSGYKSNTSSYENVTSKDTCEITFTAITNENKELLGDYITSHLGSSGNGEIVKEQINGLDTYTSQAIATLNDNPTWTTLSKNDYGLSADTNLTFANNKWTFSGTTTATFKTITIPETGYYRMCYTHTGTSTSDALFFYYPGLNSTQTSSSHADVMVYGYNVAESECFDYGELSSGQTVKLRTKLNSASGSSTFYLQKTSDYANTSTTHYVGTRYEGENPNNYVLFNNELWRIIGAFPNTSFEDNQGNKTNGTVTKIIRNESIGGYAYNKRPTLYNYWYKAGSPSSLNNLLNTYYLGEGGENNNSYIGTNSDDCVFYGQASGDVKRNCNYSKIGIKSEYKNMTVSTNWYLGGFGSAVTSEATFISERGPSTGTMYVGASGGDKVWFGKVGLMYPSDYGYSIKRSDCERTTNLSAYNTTTCGGKSWMLQNGYEWTISPSSTNASYVWRVGSSGYVSNGYARNGYAVRPVLNLSSSVYIVSGDGSLNNPYVLGL